jgi:pyruvate ferredoxin oxidoreductase alpha subunit
MVDDAEYVLIMSNSFSTLGKAAVQNARKNGLKAGLIRLRLLRPFPADDIRKMIRGKKAAAVIDQNISIGNGGILYAEIAGVMYNEKKMPLLLSFIGGLGGKSIGSDEFEYVIYSMVRAVETGRVELPRLLYTETEWKEMEKVKEMAGRRECGELENEK